MSLEREEVRRIAALARLDLAAAEEQAVAEQLGKIVQYFDQLAQFETAEPPAAVPLAAEPLAAEPLTAELLTAEPTRESAEAEDLPGICLQPEGWRANAPQTMDGYLVVPKVKSTP